MRRKMEEMDSSKEFLERSVSHLSIEWSSKRPYQRSLSVSTRQGPTSWLDFTFQNFHHLPVIPSADKQANGI
jgi:hypothetical protein